LDEGIRRASIVIAVIVSIVMFVLSVGGSNSTFDFLWGIFLSIVVGFVAWMLVRLIWWAIKGFLGY
jgi:hypothetical protein